MDYESFFYPLDRIEKWNQLYGKNGFIQLQCVLPENNILQNSQQLLEMIQQSDGHIFLGVLKRFGSAGKGLLSFPQPGFTLALDMPFEGEKTLALLNKCHAFIADAGGRVYLAKDVCLTRDHFQRMYPNYKKWLAIKQKIDPDNLFQSSLSRRITAPF